MALSKMFLNNKAFICIVVLVLVASALAARHRLKIGKVESVSGRVTLLSEGTTRIGCTQGTIVYVRDVVVLGPGAQLTIRQSNGLANSPPVGKSELARLSSVAELADQKQIETFTKTSAKARAGAIYPTEVIPVPASPFLIRPLALSPHAEITLSDGPATRTFKVAADAAGCYADPKMAEWLVARQSQGSTWFTFRIKGDRMPTHFSLIPARDIQPMREALPMVEKDLDDFGRGLERSRILSSAGQYTLAAHELALLLDLAPDPNVRALLDALIKKGYWRG